MAFEVRVVLGRANEGTLSLEADMGLAQIKDEIGQLSADQQLSLVEEIWDRLSNEASAVPVPESHLQELRRRLADHDASPDDVVAWADLKGELGS